jgi:predicted ATP-binding protein involved in virulence
MAEINTSKTYENDVFITDITIHKVRHLKDIHIPLSEDIRKHLILTGKNGSGKTSVLERLKASVLEILYQKYLNPDERKAWNNQTINEASKLLSVNFNSSELRTYQMSGSFLMAFYGASRLAKMNVPKGVEKIHLKTQYKIDEKPGQDFLQYIVNLKADKSFAKDDNDLETVKRIDHWFKHFETSLKEIFDDPSLHLEFDRKNYTFQLIQENKEPFGFNTLADGYSAIINVVTDLILRMEAQKAKSYDVQGLVLIDELEAHLHIDLQKKIFPFLTRFFPRLQFIVSTHSPFIINSIENTVIYDLEKNLLVNDLSGYSYDGIVEGYFANDKYSEIIKSKIEQYELLVNREKRTEKEEDQMMELRDYLEEIPGSLASGLKAKFQQIELDRVGKQDD